MVARGLTAWALVLALGACGAAEEPPAVAPEPASAEPGPRQHVAPEPEPEPGIARHAEDGGWAPSEELLARALALGDPETAAAALAALEAGSDEDWANVLRAGLRLADEQAARACAAQLNWDLVDGWESARVVALLPASYVLAEAEGHVFHSLREILGSDDIPGFVADLPPLPWTHEPSILGHLHRMDRDEHFPAMVTAALAAEPEVADVLDGNLWVAMGYSDRHRGEIARYWLADLPLHDDDRDPPEGALPSDLRRLLRARVLDADDVTEAISPYWLRALRDAPPREGGPKEDLDFRMRVLERLDDDGGCVLVHEQMTLHLGGLRDARTDAYLRRQFDDDDESAVRALALRGDPLALEAVTRWYTDDSAEDVDVAVLLAAQPEVITEVLLELLGDDEDAVLWERLEDLREGVYAAHMWGLPYNLDCPAFRALESAALESHNAVGQVLLGAYVDGCRTQRLARAAAKGLEELPSIGAAESWWGLRDELGWIEVAARDELLVALRRLALDEEPEDADDPPALSLLLALDDPEFPPELLTRAENVDVDDRFGVTGRRSPVLAEHWKSLLRDAAPKEASSRARELARWQGLPPPVAVSFDTEDGALPSSVIAALLDDRPVDALAAMLAANPDAEFPDIGLIDDPRVTAHLQRLREKRELRLYWFATAELAMQGDPAAREEYLQQLRIGRYRIVDQGTLNQRTLGLDLSTVPFLISELRSNCCRVVTHGDGDLIEDLLGIDGFGSATRGRVTPHELANRAWGDAGGRFAWSMLAERLVPVPR